MATQLLISRNGGTGIAIDLPYGNKPPVSYKYSLESDDLSAFTTAYTTSINLPKTHTNCQAFNFPDNVGYGATDTVDKFTYTYSVDLEPSGTFTDSGKCVISSVTDTININLFSTLADFNTALDNAEWPTDVSYVYKNAYNSDSGISPNTDFQPCICGFDEGLGALYSRSQFWNSSSCPTTMSGIVSSNLFKYGMVDIGMPEGTTCDIASHSNWKISPHGYVKDTDSIADFSFLQAPSFTTIFEDTLSIDRIHQLRWYWVRLFIPLTVLFNNTSVSGYSLSLSPSAVSRLRNLYYAGPRIGDLIDSDRESTTFNKSIKDYYLDDEGTPNGRFGKFHARDVFAKVEKPADVLKRVCKQFNLRLRIVSTSTFQICTTEEFYTSSSATDITSLIDRSVYQVSPHSFKHSDIVFEGEAVESAVLKSYKDTTSYEFNRGKYSTGYNVTSEKKWFGDSYKYVTSYPHSYAITPWDARSAKYKYRVDVDTVGAYDAEGNEVDIVGCIVSGEALSTKHCYLLGDATTSTDSFEYYLGYYDEVYNPYLLNQLSVGPTTLNYFDVQFFKSPNFVYGEPTYKIDGQSTINLFTDTNGYNWFSDVLDSLTSSLVSTNVVFGADYTSIASVINKMYWFDNNYWVVWEIGSFIPGSKEPCEVTFLKVNDINNYLNNYTAHSNTTSIDHGSISVKVNGTTIPTSSSFTTNHGDSVEVSMNASSGYLLNTLTFNGETTTFTNPTSSYTFTYTSITDSSVVVDTQLAYTITSSAGSDGSISPSGTTIVPQGSSVTLVATPNDGYVVASWTDNGVTTYTTNTEFTISNIQESHIVSVAFRTDACQVIVSPWNLGSSAVGGGLVGYTDSTHPTPTYSASPITINGHYGETINLVQYASPGFNFVNWQKSDHSYLAGSSSYEYTFTSAADNVYAAYNDGTLYQWLVGSTIGGGSGTCSPMAGQAAAGATVTVVATPASGSTWGGWYENDGTTRITTSQTLTFQMPATHNYTVRPKFELDEGVPLNAVLPPVGTIYYSVDSGSTWTAITSTTTTIPTDSQVFFKYNNIVNGVDYTDFSSWGGDKSGDTHNPTTTSVRAQYGANISVNLTQRTLTLTERDSGSVNQFICDGTTYTPSGGTTTLSGRYAGKTYALNYTTTSGWATSGGWSDSASASRNYLMPKSNITLTATPTYVPGSVDVDVSLADGLSDAGAQLYYSIDGQQTWIPHAGGTFSVAEGTLVYVKVVHEDDEGNSYVSTEGWTWGTSGQPTGQAIISNTVGSSGWLIGTCNATRYSFTAVAESGSPEGASVTCSISGTNYAGTSATITAIAPSGYSFEKWSDNNTTNPRTMRIPAATTTMQAQFVERVMLSEPTVSITEALVSKTVKVNGNTVTSFPHQIYAGDSIEVTLVLDSYYAVESWTVNSSTETSEYPLTYTYTVPTPAVSITLFQANLYKYKEVGINVLNSAPSGAGATAYYTLSGTQHDLTVGTESAPVINVVPISASSITVTATEVSSYVNESCVVAEDQSGTVVIEEVPMTNHVSVIPQSSILLYEDTFFIIPQYSAPTTKRISFASTDSTAPSGLVLKYQIGSGSVQTYSQPFYAPTNSSVTLYYERGSYADAYQWFSDGTHISGNDNQQSYSFTVTANVDITVSTKQVTIYFAENPDPQAFSGAILFSIGGTDVTQYSGYEGDSVTVTARSGNAYFNGWTDGASNPRSITIPHSSTTYLANYLEAYTVSAVTTTEGNRDAFDTLTMTIQVPGGSAVEYEPTTSHSNIPVGSTIKVYWSLTDYYSASSWQGSSVPASSPSTFTMGNQALNLTLVVTKWYHLKANIGAIIGGSISNFLYSTNSGQSWSDAGIPSSTDYVSVPVGSWVKLQATVDSGYLFSEWQLDGSTLSGSQGLNQFTWNTSSNPPAGMDSMLTAVYSGGTSWNGLTFTSTGTTTLYLEVVGGTYPDCQYSSDGVNWSPVSTDSTTPTSFSGVIFIKGSNVSGFSTAQTSYSRFHFGGSYVAASGNVMSLIDGVGDTTTIPSVFCFYMLFDSCTLLTSMPTLTATNVTQACYRNMFSNCTALTETSQFPAVAVDGANNCMRRMFYKCSSLSIVRVSNVTKTSTSTSTSSATYQWLGEVASTGTFYRMSTTSKWVANNVSGIPVGWRPDPE